MRFDVMTLFPDLITAVCGESIIGRAAEAGILSVNAHNIRDFSKDKHRRVDDTPYGGGMGMVMRPDPIVDCFRAIKAETEGMKRRVIYMSPQGALLTQKKAKEYLVYDNIVLLCGHYEGVDQRAIDAIVDEEISIGNYVLTGGELPACIFIDCVSRMLEGTLASPECYEEESISCGMLEYPQYTRPVEFEGARVPEVLQGGNHAEIAKWRYRAALEKTKRCRPDLL
ncbi:MAG: tRNA (guanosine(37)-N1)-methyltransferase TrmD [Clostridia bacterium]|nr:tRNA (guanosine(37)-N1)-methyltransferase TrmD [Clostridia bacterium]MBQ4574916.1 tRNA (guanosine(37)-N1)-methyltransferase TrmD [Clostridia bacterium]